MDIFEERLDELLVDTFRNILKVEEMLIKTSNSPLTISEIHLLEAVEASEKDECTVSYLASELNITLPSVTIAVGKLEKKGFLIKQKNKNDGRSVYISMTREGEKICRMHRYFHLKMVRAVSSGLNEEERSVLMEGIRKLDKFFKEQSQNAKLED